MDRTGPIHKVSREGRLERMQADATGNFTKRQRSDAESADFRLDRHTREDMLKMVWAALGATGYVPDAYDGREHFTKEQLYALMCRIWALRSPSANPEDLQHVNGDATLFGKVTFPEVEDWRPDMDLPPSLYLIQKRQPKYRAFTRNRAVGNKEATASDPLRAVGAVAADLDEENEWVTDYGHDGSTRMLVNEYVRADTDEFQPFYTSDHTEIGCPSCTFPTLSWTLDPHDAPDDCIEGACPRCDETLVVKQRTCVHIKK